MSRKRRQHSAEFKTKVALGVLSVQKTLSELAEQSSTLFAKGGSLLDKNNNQV